MSSSANRAPQGTEASQERLRLARKLAALWTALPGCRAVAVVGSAAEGTSDSASDLDMCVFWETAPRREDMDTVKAQAGEGERILFLGDPAEGGCVESYRVEGIKVDFAHSTAELWHQHTDEVLEKLNLDSPWQKGMSGTLSCNVLYGSEFIGALQARLRPYSESLRQAMLSRYCRFLPLYALRGQALGRGDLLWLKALLVEYSTNMLYTLCALNGAYHAMEFKRLHRFIERELPIAPPNLHARLDAMLLAKPEQAVEQVAELVRETLSLVEQHCPAFDVAPAKARFELVI